MANKITTVKLLAETKKRLEKLREHKRETYDDIIRKMLYVLSIVKIEPDKAREILDKIDELRKRTLSLSKKKEQREETN